MNRDGLLAAAGSAPACRVEDEAADGDLMVHVTTWHAADQEDDDDEGDEEEEGEEDEEDVAHATREFDRRVKRRYVIRAFGVTQSGRSACVRIDGFTPFFYVKVPEDLDRRTAVPAIEKHLKDTVRSAKIMAVRKKDFWGYTGGREFDFFRLAFESAGAMRGAAARLKGPQPVRGLMRSPTLRPYESNVDPLLRFLHISGAQPVGWIRLPASDVRVRTGRAAASGTTCQLFATCPWRSVQSVVADSTRPPPPLIVAGFDIECDSAHGDFPVAAKDYRRLAIDLEQAWLRDGGLKAMNDYDAKMLLVELMRCSMDPSSAQPEVLGAGADGTTGVKGIKGIRMPPISRLQLKRPVVSDADSNAVKEAAKRVVDDVYAALKTTAAEAAAAAISAKRIAARVAAGLDEDDDDDQGFFSPRKRGPPSAPAPAAAAATKPAPKPIQIKNETPADDAEPEVETSTLGRLTAALNGAFLERWPLRGDAVIQIGVTIGMHPGPGGGACCSKHILVLGTCEPIEGVDVRCFADEAEMLVAFVDLVRALDPDVLLGYNIFGFDMAYMRDRAVELMGIGGCEARFCRFGRIAGLPSAYVEQKLSSSALGDNVLKYLDMHGRVVVDLMKVVQRDHRLDSYKLDAVAGNLFSSHGETLGLRPLWGAAVSGRPTRSKSLTKSGGSAPRPLSCMSVSCLSCMSCLSCLSCHALHMPHWDAR